MARAIPKSIQARLSTFETHIAQWAENPAAIGLTAAQVDELAVLLKEAQDAHRAAEEARAAAEAATVMQNSAIDTLVQRGSNAMQRIRAFAAGDVQVLTQAQLQPIPRGVRSNVPPPRIENFRAVAIPNAGIELRWESDLKRTTFYEVARIVSIGDERITESLGAVRGDRFIDRTLPRGYFAVEYRLTPVKQRAGSPPIRGLIESVLYSTTVSELSGVQHAESVRIAA